MSDTRYSDDHEWIRPEGDVYAVGITQYAEQQLGDVVYVELPEPGKALAKHGEAGVVESVKAVNDIYAPVAGEITESNPALPDNPALINEDPEGAAWFFKMRLADAGQLEDLMDSDAYAKYVGSVE